MNKILKSFMSKVDSDDMAYAVYNYYKQGTDPVLDELVPQFVDIYTKLEARIEILVDQYEEEYEDDL